jgi:hypothetical protein
MRQATLADLVAADDPDSGEFPPDFDYNAEMARVAALRGPLETLTGYALELDKAVQDASFLTELYARDPIPRPHPAAGQVIETFVAVRFSSFAHFFTIWGCYRERPLTDELRFRVAEFVSQHGYLYVQPDLLDLPHPSFGTWWIRYFDYL